MYQTTSIVAGGIWEPHLAGDTPEDDINRWSEFTYKYYSSLYMSEDASVAGIERINCLNNFDHLEVRKTTRLENVSLCKV